MVWYGLNEPKSSPFEQILVYFDQLMYTKK